MSDSRAVMCSSSRCRVVVGGVDMLCFAAPVLAGGRIYGLLVMEWIVLCALAAIINKQGGGSYALPASIEASTEAVVYVVRGVRAKAGRVGVWGVLLTR